MASRGRRGYASSEGRECNSDAESFAVSGRISGNEANSFAEDDTGDEGCPSSKSGSPGNDAAD